MRGRIQSVVGVTLILIAGNLLLVSFILSILRQEGEKRVASVFEEQEKAIIGEVRGRVETTCSMIGAIQRLTGSEATAQQYAIDAVTMLRFGEGNYVWIHRVDPENIRSAVILAHPAVEERGKDKIGSDDLEGIPSVYYNGVIVPRDDPRVRHVMAIDLGEEFNRIALTKGEGTISYYWPKVVDGAWTPVAYRKVAFVKYLPQWHWVVGAGAYADTIDSAINRRSTQLAHEQRRLMFRIVSAIVGFSLVIVLLVSWLTWRMRREQIVKLTEEVAERRRAEGALRDSETRFRILFEAASDAIFTFEAPSWSITNVNDAAVKMFNAGDKERLIGIPPWDLSPERQPEGQLSAERAETLLAETLAKGAYYFEWSHRKLSGETFPATVVLTKMEVAGKVLILSSVRDVTQAKRMQEELLQAQKMESVGRLAGGVAHDFNNLLAVILGYTEMVLMELAQNAPGRAELQAVLDAAKRAKSLTQQLLAFSRKQVLEIKVLDFNKLIEGMQPMLRRMLGEDIQMCVDCAKKPMAVKGDMAQLEQVLMNLCVNARDAMPYGGALTVRTESVDAAAIAAHAPEGPLRGRYVVLSAMDTGAGMDEETSKRIFEPFFTTKEKGRGTGLGLATVYGIVSQHNGHVWVESAIGHGATFFVCFPEVLAAPSDGIDETNGDLTLGNGETVLLLEDDETVRVFAGRLLRNLGYHVISTNNPEECLAYARGNTPFDLLLTDVILPGMNGRQVADQVISMRPSIKTLFMSGFTQDVVVHRGAMEENVHFIKKPFSAAEFSLKLREALKG